MRTRRSHQVLLEFRKRFSELKASIPTWYSAPAIPDGASAEDLRAIERYWQNAFDEWFVTNKLERWHLRKLWNRFYKGTLTLALSNGALRQAAANLTHGGPEFGDHQDEFRGTLNALCWRAYNEPLCGNESCRKRGSATCRPAAGARSLGQRDGLAAPAAGYAQRSAAESH